MTPPLPHAHRLAIANRGEIAIRIAATCRQRGLIPVLVCGEPDRGGLAARVIGRVELTGPAGSELDPEAVVAAARRAGATLLHPGYGFLSERPALAAACDQAGIQFVGPTAETLEICGDKVAARDAAVAAGIPALAASEPLSDDPEQWRDAAATIGYPLLVKAVAGGGGASLRRVNSDAELTDAVASSRREAEAAGAGPVLYLERFLENARHLEVQVVGDGPRSLALGDRECSLQRRHQKVIEEAPAPNLPQEHRARLLDFAEAIAAAVTLRSLATVEFLYGADGTIAFIEVNPRLQVEHPVTELVTGLDLVDLQLDVATGCPLPEERPLPRGHAIEARLYAEDPANHFLPSPGRLDVFTLPNLPGLRVDAGYQSGDQVPGRYDPMLAKLIAWGPSRDQAVVRLRDALEQTAVAGVATNRPWLLALLADARVRDGHYTTQTAASVAPAGATSRPPDLIAAALVATELERPPSSDPWERIGPFRLDGATELAFHSAEETTGDEWEIAVPVQRDGGQWAIALDGEPRSLYWLPGPDGVWTIRLGEEATRVAVARRTGGRIEVVSSDGRWLASPGRRASRGARPGQRREDAIRAPLPGQILRVEAEPGARVRAGDPLVILSAMKIEIVLRASHPARVKAVHCRPAEQVDAGDLLVELTPEGDE